MDERRYKIFASVVKIDESNKLNRKKYLLCTVLAREFEQFKGSLENFFLSRIPPERLDQIEVPSRHVVRISICRRFRDPILKQQRERELASILLEHGLAVLNQ